MFATGPRAVSADDQDWFAVEWDDGGGEGDNAPHLDQNVLSQLRRRSPGLDSGPLGWPLFPPPAWPGQRPLPYLAQTWHSKIEIRDENRK